MASFEKINILELYWTRYLRPSKSPLKMLNRYPKIQYEKLTYKYYVLFKDAKIKLLTVLEQFTANSACLFNGL